MFLDGLPQTLTPLGVGGAGAADVQAGLRKTLRAVLDVQVGAGTMSVVASLHDNATLYRSGAAIVKLDYVFAGTHSTSCSDGRAGRS